MPAVTWEQAGHSRRFPLAYASDPHGEAYIAGSSLVDFMRHLAAELDAKASELAADGAPDDYLSAAVGAARLAEALAESFVLFSLEPDRQVDA